ncbi:hypothetical protein [Chamaesiphon sp. VAR_69_metabat_338]|uniref:hypothetical protein n=1 Tax=Chamaesiphon sp. VAR_69_metabat_338 TaxID=2964704 RepID=UPI00286E9B0D|nr:hypothetical protein [Chamaesiphon sp. VAR_69_metabat_338]
MAYNNFTLPEVTERFDLTLTGSPFCADLPVAAPSELFSAIFQEWFPLAQQARSEKAKSELLISPVLLEVRKLVHNSVELFSGEEFSVDRERGLNGFCDFLLSKSTTPYIIQAPVVMLVEAKRGELDLGLGQCIAEMVAAQIFNDSKHKAIPIVYGSVTSGRAWQFLKLEGKNVTVDANEYQVTPVERILGILKWMIEGSGSSI